MNNVINLWDMMLPETKRKAILEGAKALNISADTFRHKLYSRNFKDTDSIIIIFQNLLILQNEKQKQEIINLSKHFGG